MSAGTVTIPKGAILADAFVTVARGVVQVLVPNEFSCAYSNNDGETWLGASVDDFVEMRAISPRGAMFSFQPARGSGANYPLVFREPVELQVRLRRTSERDAQGSLLENSLPGLLVDLTHVRLFLSGCVVTADDHAGMYAPPEARRG